MNQGGKFIVGQRLTPLSGKFQNEIPYKRASKGNLALLSTMATRPSKHQVGRYMTELND